MTESFIIENRRERKRLQAFVGRLTDSDLSSTVREGWTVASILAHLAFWDRRQLALLKRWRRLGATAAPLDVESVNESVLALSDALAPRAAARLAVEAAEAVDGEIEKLPPELVESIEAVGHGRALMRFLHRREHLAEIERALATAPGSSQAPQNSDRLGS